MFKILLLVVFLFSVSGTVIVSKFTYQHAFNKKRPEIQAFLPKLIKEKPISKSGEVAGVKIVATGSSKVKPRRITKPKPSPSPKKVTKKPSPIPSSSIKPSPTPKPTPSPLPTSSPKNTILTNSHKMRITFYGFVDNSPSGKEIAFAKAYNKGPTIHNLAGGVGSFSDPVTVAAVSGRFPIGTKFYVPYVKKYLILEDICGGCSSEHLDIWMESNENYAEELLECENKWTRGEEVIEIDPPFGRVVSTAHFFNTENGECRTSF